jgi:hypothetical protein
LVLFMVIPLGLNSLSVISAVLPYC